mgnify:FL=1
MPRKRPNELCECDWSNQHTRFIDGDCDTQGIKKIIYIDFYLNITVT